MDSLGAIEIGFADFTTNLILKVFDGLVAANLSQTEAYLQLVQSLSKTLSAYVNDTKDDIGGAEVLQFLSTVLPKDPTTGQPAQVAKGTTLAPTDAAALNNALALPTADGGNVGDNKVAPTTALDDAGTALIYDAVARRLAANKYAFLKEMVKQGLLRLVVTQGLIETRLTYNAATSSYYQSNQSTYDTKQFNFTAQAQTGSALARWVKASASVNYTTVSVKTTNSSQQDYNGSSVNVFGLVRIEFKSDYLPLAT